jgi:ornithine cyclodeaminase/alanine dehydrogenase-like protein (mu-crystallin family)
MPLILSNEEVARVLTMKTCLDALEEAYREQAAGRAVNQLRYDTNMPLPDRPERQARYEFKTMVGILPISGVAALRMSSTLNHRPMIDGMERSERLYLAPGGSTVGLLQLYSVHTGELLALMPDGVIQGMRVGGTYGLALKYLARENASILGLLGSGWQARFQLTAASLVRTLKHVKVYSPTREHRETFARELRRELGIDVAAVESASEAASGVDILIAATNARAPIITGEFVRKGMHVSAVQNELSEQAFAKADLIVAHSSKRYLVYEGGQGQYGSVVPQRGSAEHEKLPLLEDVIAGKVKGRTSADQITMYRSGSGMGLQFAAVGARVLQLAREQGLGHELPNDWFTQTLHT